MGDQNRKSENIRYLVYIWRNSFQAGVALTGLVGRGGLFGDGSGNLLKCVVALRNDSRADVANSIPPNSVPIGGRIG